MICDINQNTPEWLSFRASRIGASDVSAILGINPWCTALQLWKRKTGNEIPQEKTFAMQRGCDLEQTARWKFQEDNNVLVSPAVFTHPEYNFLMASLDGISIDLDIAVEIKCNGKENHKLALEGKIPDYYISQMQHQMFCTGLKSIFYYSFDGKNGVTIKVDRDDSYIEEMLNKELEFYKCMIELMPPNPSPRDFLCKKNNPRWGEVSERYWNVKKQLQELSRLEELYKTELIDMADDHNCVGGGVKLQKVMRAGNVDYKRIPELIGVDLEIHRTEPIVSWRVLEDK